MRQTGRAPRLARVSRMKQRGWPLWLLRDVRAFFAVLFSFWSLMVASTIGRSAMRDGRVTQGFLDRLATNLAIAEAWLDWAFWRQAHRRLGLDHRGVKPVLIPPATTSRETLARWQSYSRAFRNMQRVVDSYVDALRARYRISARAASPMLRMEEEAHAPQARCLSSSGAVRRGSRRVASSRRDGGGSRHCRGPPQLVSAFRNHPPRRPRLRERARMPATCERISFTPRMPLTIARSPSETIIRPVKSRLPAALHGAPVNTPAA